MGKKVLLNIFAAADDIDLMSLAENSIWFGRIAKMALDQRYTNDYFKIDKTMYDISQMYIDFIQLFGSQIKSIHAMDTVMQGDLNWIGTICKLKHYSFNTLQQRALV